MGLFPPQYFRKTEGIIRRGLAANRPNAADVLIGTLYFSSDTGVLERSNGATWDSYSGSGTPATISSPVVLTDREYDDSPQVPLIGSNIAKYDDFAPTFKFDVEVKQQLIVDGSFAVLGAAANINATLTSISTLQVVNAPLDLLGGQLKFPAVQNASANANTLDDCERGTWTPSFQGSVATGANVYSRQNGFYTKLADLVIAWFSMQLSSLVSITGNVLVGGLPFTVKNTASGDWTSFAAFWSSWATAFTVVQVNPIFNDTKAFVLINTAAATSIITQPTSADMNNTTDLRACVIYRATS